MNINTEKMKPIELIENENVDDKLSLFSFKNEAVGFLSRMNWCRKIKKGCLGFGIEGIIGIFYFQIEPVNNNVDNELWIIVGDIPPAYIAIDDCPNPFCALDAYIYEMELWVNAVKTKKPVDDLIPVNVPPTLEYAEMLGKRLKFLDQKILSEHKDELV